MGRKKQLRPHRSVGIRGKQAPGAELCDNNDARAEKDKLVEVDEPFFVEVDRSTWLSDEHMDISEIVLSDLSIKEEFYGYRLSDELYGDSRYLLRFRLDGVSQHLSRIKLGHWPVLSASSIVVELVAKHMKEGGEEHVVMVSGNLDGPDEGVSGLVHLASLKLLTLRPAMAVTFLEGLLSFRIRVEILRAAFEACETLLDNTRQLWKKSMISVMAWLRPEVTTSEARYGYNVIGDKDTGLGTDENSSASRKCAKLDVVSFYEAIKPSKEDPMLDDPLPNLVPELRPYQRRAVYWMVQREKGASEHSEPSKINPLISPLCMPLSLIDKSAAVYYNPFSGNVSLHPDSSFCYVSGGILADEMGLGKTVELLACVFAHQVTSSAIGSLSNSTQLEQDQRKNLKRLKRARVECICGSVSESIRYKGLWVQCDVCDAWQHADCVGYSPKKHKKMKASEEEMHRQDSSGKLKNRAKRKGIEEIVEMDGVYICRACSELIQATEAPVASGATLIVCPTPILPQWHAEIIRHTKPGSLRTCIYEGVRNSTLSETPLMDINELLSSDIVLTTYDVLKEDLSHDSDRHDGDRRFLRFEKRYPVIPTLLTRILWWRICLDEAQMVESNAAAATEMALRLRTVHRWCITGTPIQRKLDDLYGLLKFLKASPFDVFRWWTDVICDPYERGDEGAVAFTHKFFKPLMWRSSKGHVADELQLPPQEECVSWLSLSPIEKHFYQRQHETCVNDAHELIADLKDNIHKKKPQDSNDSLSGVVITNMDAAKLFNSLLKLRQACCHPQVGSSGLRSLQQSPMTMEEILSVLVGKTKVEGEEELRKVVVALNALAGIAIIEKNIPQAISLYKEALALTEEHSEDFRLDPLLNIHIHHNLAEILPQNSDGLETVQSAPGSSKESSFMTEGVDDDIQSSLKSETRSMEAANFTIKDLYNPVVDSATNYSGDGSSDVEPEKQRLRTSCEILKQRYLSVFNSKLYMAQQEFRKSFEQVCNAFTDRKNQHTAWWLESLHHIEQNKDLSSELIRKIGEAVSGTMNTNRASRIASCFRSITALKYFIQTGLDSLEGSRKTLLDRLLEIDQTMGNPRKEDIERVRYCPKCYANTEGPMCVHCELDDLFQAYEASLFRLNKGKYGEAITSAEEAVNLQKKMSALNRFFYSTLSQSNKNPTSLTLENEDNGSKRDTGERVMVSKSPSDLEVVLGIIKSNSRGLLDREGMSAATKQLLLLEAMRKEYPQARYLSTAQAQVLRAYDEISMATSRLRLREDENDKSIDALDLGELDVASAEFSSEKFLALSSLSRVKGQLRYLKGLVQSKQKQQPESTDDTTSTQAMVTSRTSEENQNGSFTKAEEDACPICHEKLNSQKMVFQCGHVICCKCLIALTEQRSGHLGKPVTSWVMCPTCRQHTDYRNIAYAVDREHKSDEIPFDASENSEASITVQGSYSTKVEAVTRRILWINSKNSTAKVLVFSSWNDVLDVLAHAFAANDISYIRMKGGRKAHAAINHFRGQNSNSIGRGRSQDRQPDAKPVQVLLILIQHGANGLNLLEAEHVILVEPLLNPAAEAQAISRVHRIGQAKKTLVHRFIVKDTVEESIYKLNKSRTADSFVSGNRKNQDQPVLTLKDIESLFRVDQNPSGSLMHLPPSVAAALAAERRLAENTTSS
nr:E3 ubiquitin-protein ligase SHPRH isoform X1 [Ipomoea trifida]